MSGKSNSVVRRASHSERHSSRNAFERCMLHSVCWMLDVVCRILDAGCWILDVVDVGFSSE